VINELKRNKVEVTNMIEELQETSEIPCDYLIKENESLAEDIGVCEEYLAAERERQRMLRVNRKKEEVIGKGIQRILAKATNILKS
jgi:hypothetical protein